MKVRPLPAPQILINMNIKYEIIFKGATFKNREIEIYLPEYKYSQFILPAPIGDSSIFGTTNDNFWRSHHDLKLEVNKICNDIAYKHLWFLMGWDLRVDDQWSTIECWKYYLNDWRKNYKGFNPTDEQFQWAIDSYGKKYVREKGKRIFQFIEQ